MNALDSMNDGLRSAKRKPPMTENGHFQQNPPNLPTDPGHRVVENANGRFQDSTKSKCMCLINHEFRALQLDKQMASMSVFDLIDHCALLFEQLTLEKNKDAHQLFKLYVRSFLIFNYFVNTFIMVHFNGFAQFMESSLQDFIIYLNLYNFYRSDDIVGPHAFDISPLTVREWIVEYLESKHLLTFDVDLLYNWLDEYIEYLKHKETAGPGPWPDEETQSGEIDRENRIKLDSLDSLPPLDPQPLHYSQYSPVPLEALEHFDAPAEEDLFDFNTRFPELSLADNVAERPVAKSPNMAHPGQQSAPYPVSLGASKAAELPYPLESRVLEVLPLDGTTYVRTRPPIPRPLPEPPGTAARPASHSGSHGGHTQRVPLDTPPAHGPKRMKRDFPERAYSDFSLSQGQPRVNGTHHRVTAPGFMSSSDHQNQNQHQNQHQNQNQNQNHHRFHSQNQYVVPLASPRKNARQVYAICGLKNLGSSCYINLTVQVLVGLERFEQALRGAASKHPKPLTDATQGLIATFAGNGGANIAPTKFLRVLSSLKPDFNIPFEQQDAQELLLFLLDRLHEELAVRPPDDSEDYLRKWNISVNPRDRDEYLQWYRSLVAHEGQSAINDTFQGHVQSRLVCNQCGHRSVSYSPFTILSLPIPAANRLTIDLTDCLRYYTQDEVLAGENAWNCPKCNKDPLQAKENPMDVVFQPKRGLFRLKRSKSPLKKPVGAPAPAQTAISIKQLSFIKLPPVMFIHLSRFSMANGTDKLNTDITYPLRLKFNHLSHDIYYSLTGLINHYGTLKSGHYTALVNKARSDAPNADLLVDPLWCFFDDDNVRFNVAHGSVHSSENNKMHSRDVYVLCYERV